MGDGPTQPSEELFNRGQWGFDGTLWRRLTLLWGYSDRLAEYDTYVKSGAGNEIKTLVTVPAGYVYVIKATMSINRDTITGHNHLLRDGTNYYAIQGWTTNAVGVWAINDNVDYPLKEGDQVIFQWIACGDGDDLDASCWGYKMAIT